MAKKKTLTDRFECLNGDYTTINNGRKSKLVVSVTSKNEGQKNALRTINENKVTFLYGVPGSGKTFLAVGWALQEMMTRDRFERIVLTRPIVEAGENLGFLPGDAQRKVAPYMTPMYGVMTGYLSDEVIKGLVAKNKIMVVPLAYIRGRTFNNSCIVLDEAQNSTPEQMHLLLTRIGINCKVIITGDTEQSDLSYRRLSGDNGLKDAIVRLEGVDGIGFVELGYDSCVRDKIINDIDSRYRVPKTTLPSIEKSKGRIVDW